LIVKRERRSTAIECPLLSPCLEISPQIKD
jgi:hypothetical protein